VFGQMNERRLVADHQHNIPAGAEYAIHYTISRKHIVRELYFVQL
jgi:hypothetical protein